MTPAEQYAWVSAYWETDGKWCGGCRNCHSWKEPHGEILSACDVVEEKAPCRDCPALNAVWDENVDYSAIAARRV